MQIITFFNHKGGVAKTTNVFNLAWKLAERGNRVVMVDADSQCNLTGIAIGLMPPTSVDDELSSEIDQERLEEEFSANQESVLQFWTSVENNNIHSCLRPVFMSEARPLEAAECVAIDGNENLFLLPGSLSLADYESDLGVAQSLQGAFGSQRNLPGAFYALLNKTAERYNADYVIVDVSPSLGAINQNIVSISDQIVIPCAPDYFSVMALKSLASILPKWHAWAKEAGEKKQLTEATYPFPGARFKFSGIIISRYVIYKKKPASAFIRWIDLIKKECADVLVPALKEVEAFFDDEKYITAGEVNPEYSLAQIREFNSLRPKSQIHRVPVFSLTPEQLKLSGNSLSASMDQVKELNEAYNQFAEKLEKLGN